MTNLTWWVWVCLHSLGLLAKTSLQVVQVKCLSLWVSWQCLIRPATVLKCHGHSLQPQSFSLWSPEGLTNILSLKNSLLHLGQRNFLPWISTSLTLPWSTLQCWCSSDLLLKTLTHLLHLNTILDLWSYLKCSWSSVSLYLKTEHPEMLQTNLWTLRKIVHQMPMRTVPHYLTLTDTQLLPKKNLKTLA